MYFWQLHQKQQTIPARARSTALLIWDFFVAPWFALPLSLALLAIRDRDVAFAWALLSCAVAASLLYPFFFTALHCGLYVHFCVLNIRWPIFFLGWSIHARPLGYWLVLFIISGGLLDQSLSRGLLTDLARGRYATRAVNSRKYIEDSLIRMGGAHVVFVRYGAHHTLTDEWVYNAAQIDASPIVWCRWMGALRIRCAAILSRPATLGRGRRRKQNRDGNVPLPTANRYKMTISVLVPLYNEEELVAAWL